MLWGAFDGVKIIGTFIQTIIHFHFQKWKTTIRQYKKLANDI